MTNLSKLNLNKALDRIFYNLNHGYIYGKAHNDPSYVRYPYFDTVLCMNSTKTYIRWSHFGSSAEENNKESLEWLLEKIFDTTPEQFEKDHELYRY